MAAANRILMLDLARTAAVVGMVIFHFTFDLQMFGYLPAGTTFQPFWYYFARIVAGSFLFLSGISLWLAHGRGVRWPAFWRRFAIIAGAAALVSGVSYFATPDAIIRFGILHALAASSLVGVLFLRAPAFVTLVVAAVVFLLPWFVQSPAFDAVWLVWLGLAEARPVMADHVPLLPWLAPALAGIAVARIAADAGIWTRLAGKPAEGAHRWITFPGRHSLLIYLVHQPVLIAGFFAYAWVMRG